MCGQFRYHLNEAQKFALLCQCRDCQHITGSGYAPLFGAAVESTEFSGDTAKFHYTVDSGAHMTSVFCPVCGNPLFKTTARFPALLFFHAATLEDPSLFKPQRIVWHASGQSWDKLEPSLPVEQ